MKKSITTVSLPDALMEAMDENYPKYGATTRSAFIEMAIRDKLKEEVIIEKAEIDIDGIKAEVILNKPSSFNFQTDLKTKAEWKAVAKAEEKTMNEYLQEALEEKIRRDLNDGRK